MADTSNLINLDRLTTYHGLITQYIDDKTALGDSAVEAVNTLIEDTSASGKKLLAESITDKGVAIDRTATFAEMADAIDSIKTGSGTATADQVLQGATFTNSTGEELTGTIPKVTVSSPVTPGTSDSKIISGKSYVNNDVTVKGDSGLVAANIRSGASIFGVSGGFTGDATATAAQILSGKTAGINGAMVTGTMTDHGAVTPAALAAGGSYTIPAGFHNGSGKVTVADLASQTSATATATDMLSGKTAYVNGALVTGSIASKAAATYTPGTSNQTIAAGQYLSGAQTIAGSSNLVAGNIKSGVKIFNVTGSMSEAPTITNTSMSITTNKSFTIPRSTDLVNMIFYNGSSYCHTMSTSSGDVLCNAGSNSNYYITLSSISSSSFTIKSGSSCSGTLYYSHGNYSNHTSVTISKNSSVTLPRTTDLANIVFYDGSTYYHAMRGQDSAKFITSGSNSDYYLSLSAVSSSGFTIKAGKYAQGTLYYSY